MPVGRAGRALAIVAALSSASGCRGRTEAAPRRPPPIVTSAEAGAGASAASGPFLDRARAAREAAAKLAGSCYLVEEWAEDFERYHDVCRWTAADADALRQAARGLAALAPEAGLGASFAEHVRLFVEWVELLAKADTSSDSAQRPSGTLAHYQELAAAWNALQPAERVPLDVGKSSYLNPDGTPAPARPDGGAFVWQRCSNGRCIVAPRRGAVR